MFPVYTCSINTYLSAAYHYIHIAYTHHNKNELESLQHACALETGTFIIIPSSYYSYLNHDSCRSPEHAQY